VKKSLLALSLGLAASLAGASAYANTGNILFEGKITASTCPIQIVNPDDDAIGNHVNMGTVDVSSFTAIGDEMPGKGFVMRIRGDGGCTITPGQKATVTFNGSQAGTDPYFALRPAGATGVAISLKENGGVNLAPGVASSEYPLTVGAANDIRFDAFYRKTAATVTAGSASADILFVVDII
jgi:type 1 fimbria pilin